MSLFSIWWCLLKAAFFWKSMLLAIYAKILHYSFVPTIYENFKSFYLSSTQENFETCIQAWFE